MKNQKNVAGPAHCMLLLGLLLSQALPAQDRRPVDQFGQDCGRVSPSYDQSTPDYVAYSVTNRCDKALYIDGRIGSYPIGTIISPGETKIVGCMRKSVDCGDGLIKYSFKFN